MYQQVRAHLQNLYPDLSIRGGNFSPGAVKEMLSKAVVLVYMAAIAALVIGNSFFTTLGLPVPDFFRAAQENKVG